MVTLSPKINNLNSMKKALLVILIFSGICKSTVAQDFPYGGVTQAELDMKNYSKDTSAHAVVLQEYGKTKIAVTNDDNIKVIFEYHVKIKIFDNKAFDEGTVEIPVYNNSDNDSYEEVSGIKGVTFYTDDNGSAQKTELEEKKVYPEKINKHYALYKFAMPGIKSGCIIEYKYTIESPYWLTLHDWQFQSDIPKVYSEYEVHIPGFWVYNASLKGPLKLTKQSADIEPGCFQSHGATAGCSLLVYGMANVPAFIKEDDMTSPKNFMSAINFELAEYTSPYTGSKTKITKEWKDVDYELKNNPDFGGQLKRKGLFKDKIAPVIAGKTADLAKAKAVYAYIQRYFKWNEHSSIVSVDGLGKAVDSHGGSVADINLSLVVALNVAGLNAYPVVLSTRENGIINTLYPVLSDFDYVIAQVNIGDKSYLLDATDPLLGFGMLPFRCLNDKGRVMSFDKPSVWIDLSSQEKKKSSRILDLTLTDDGKLKGTVTNYFIGYEAYSKRKEIAKYNSTDEYAEKLNAEWPKIKILKTEITNLDSLDLPLGEKFDVEINAYNKLENSMSFNPFFWNRLTVNPFKLDQRNYPVDMGIPSDDKIVLFVHLPPQYTITNTPQTMSIALPANGGRFITDYQADGNMFTFSHGIQLNKSIYSSEEYPYLKELYNKIIQSEKPDMIFKKK